VRQLAWKAFLLLASLAVPAHSQDAPSPRPGTMSIRGEGRTDIKPDYAVFTVTVSTRAPTLDEAATSHPDRATRALAALQEMKGSGITVRSSSFNLNQDRPLPILPARDGQPPVKPPEPQFTAVTTFSLKGAPIDDLNAAVTKIAASGLLEIRGVSFRVEQERNALNEARRAAMRDAKEQAEAYADAGGLKLGEILEVSDGQATPPRFDGAADMPAPRFVQIIPPATVRFDASVNVTWRIAAR
jgi:uncharacterized protein YggE